MIAIDQNLAEHQQIDMEVHDAKEVVQSPDSVWEIFIYEDGSAYDPLTESVYKKYPGIDTIRADRKRKSRSCGFIEQHEDTSFTVIKPGTSAWGRACGKPAHGPIQMWFCLEHVKLLKAKRKD